MKPAAEDLLSLLAQRRTLFRWVHESEEPPTKQTLINELDYSRPTVNRLVRDLRDWGLIVQENDDLIPTLLARLTWDLYRTFDQRVAALEADETDGNPPWNSDTKRFEAMGLITDRFAILECLIVEPHNKRDLVTAVDSSRSTVDRAIRELEEAGLVERTSGKYTTLSPVSQVVSQYRTTVERVSDILDAQKLLAGLPHDSSIEQVLLTGATVESVTDSPPYHLPDGVRDRIAAAERVRVFLPALGAPRLLDCCHHIVNTGQTCELLTTPELFDILTTEFPGQLAAMAANRDGVCTAYRTDTSPEKMPSFGLVLAETSTTTAVSVIVYDTQDTIRGAIHNESTAAIRWAEGCDERIRAGATEVTDELRDLAPTGTLPTKQLSEVNDSTRIDREAEGFVQLTPSYFASRAPAPPLTGWRTGFDLVDVHAGYAIDRNVERDGTHHNLTEDLIDRLADDTNQAVLGPPGSGKSVVCKSVACRWYERGMGPVFYRDNERGSTFDSPAVLEDQLRATTGHALVVIEDAARTAAQTIFRVMQAFRGDPSVTFLLDARTSEWTDSDAWTIDAGLEAYRHDSVETVSMPAFDDAEAERFVHQFEQTTSREIDSTAVSQLREQWITDTETEFSKPESADKPGELLLFLHRLVLAADPLSVCDGHTPTTLVEDVQRTYETLQAVGDLALDIGVLVNLLNAAGIGVRPALVCSLAAGDDNEIAAVRDELSALEGRLLFGRETPTDSFRTVHEGWSAEFLAHFLDAETKHAAHQRVGRCLTALLALADDEDRRARIRSAFMRDLPVIDRIETAPGEWADATVEQLFEIGLHRRGLAALFGRTGESAIDLPAACSQSVTVDCTFWRAQMSREAGDLDRATHEYEAVNSLAREIETSDPAWATTLRGRRLRGLGHIAYHRDEFDAAEAYYARALQHFTDCEADNTLRRASTRMNVGNIALIQGDLETAEAYYQDCLETYSDLGHTKKKTIVLYNLGLIIERTDELARAIERYRQCLDNARTVGDRGIEATCLARLGYLIIQQGRLETAETYCIQALDCSHEIGDREHETRSLEYLGRITQIRGDLDTADAYYRQSLDIRQRIGYKRLEAESLWKLSISARKRGNLDTAAEHCTSSLDICREVDYRRGEAVCLGELSAIIREKGDLTTATERARESLRLGQEDGGNLIVAVSRQRLGRVATAREEFTTAEDHLTQALADCRDMGYRYEEAETMAALGILDRRRDNPKSAREWFEESVTAYREIGAIRDEIETIEQLAAVCDAQGTLTASLAYCEQAHDLAQETEFIEEPISLAERRNRLVNHLVEHSTD